jgi:hypothetical protein
MKKGQLPQAFFGKGVWLVVLFLTFALIVAPPGAWAETDPFDTFIPDSTLIYVSVKNLSQTRQNFKETNLYNLWEEEEIQNLVQGTVDKARQELEEAEQEIGISFKEISDMFVGEMTFVLFDLETRTVTEKKMETDWDAVDFEKFDFEAGVPEKEVEVSRTEAIPHLAIIADIGENQAALEEAIERTLDSAAEDAPQRITSESRGVAINILQGKKDPSKAVAYAFMDNLFIITWGEEALERMIAHYKMQAQTPLCLNPNYRNVVSKLGQRPDAVFFVNCEPLYDLPVEEMFEKFFKQYGPPQSPGVTFGPGYQIKDSIRNMEEASIKALGGGMTLAMGKTLLTSYSYAPGTPTGSMKIYPLEVPPARSLIFTPRETICYFRIFMDFQEYWKYFVAQMKAQSMDTGMGFFEQFQASLAQYEEEFEFSLEEDLIGSMGNEAGLFVVPKRAYDAEGTVAVVVFSALKNSARFEDALTKVRNIPIPPLMLPVQEQEYLGYRINVFMPFAAMSPGEGEAPPPPPDGPAFTITDDFFFFSSSSVLLKAVLRSLSQPVPSIQENDLFLEATAGLPGPPLSLFYADLGQLLDQLYAFIEPKALAAGEETSLPSLEVLKKHLSYISGAASFDEEGLLSVMVLP